LPFRPLGGFPPCGSCAGAAAAAAAAPRDDDDEEPPPTSGSKRGYKTGAKVSEVERGTCGVGVMRHAPPASLAESSGGES
jgi:hypothetical protein